jgi:hypothetical protein
MPPPLPSPPTHPPAWTCSHASSHACSLQVHEGELSEDDVWSPRARAPRGGAKRQCLLPGLEGEEGGEEVEVEEEGWGEEEEEEDD